MTTAICIANTSIRQDADGRYCLNDLHKAAGGLDKNKTSNWVRLESFSDLVNEIMVDRLDQGSDMSIAPSTVQHGGSNPGVFVCKELVYAYAMWISAKFHLQVIRAYDQLVTSPAAPAIPMTYREIMMLAVDNHEKLEAAKVLLAIAAPKVQVYDTVVANKNILLSHFCRLLPGVNTNAIKGDLKAMNYLHKTGNRYAVYSKYRDVIFGESLEDAYGNRDITVLAKGKELLTKLHAEGRLTMKVGYTAAA